MSPKFKNTPEASRNSAPSVTNLRVNLRENPIGICARKPRLSWRQVDKRHGAAQMAYRIQAATSPHNFAQQDLLWDTGRIDTDVSLDIAYDGPPLSSRERVYWRVAIWDAWGKLSKWSKTAFFEAGLLEPSDWQAKWIGRLDKGDKGSVPSPYLRKEFSLRDEPVRSARLYVTARGLFEASINGAKVSEDRFAPGWTEYGKTIPYLTYDVSKLLNKNVNAIGVVLGDGWYRGNLFFPPTRANYGDQLSLLCQLEIDYADGKRQVVKSDEEWASSTGPIRASDIYDGESYDARKEMPGWNKPDFRSSSSWKAAHTFPPPNADILPRNGPLTRSQENLKAISITAHSRDRYIFDFGQNMTGAVELKINGEAGQKIILRFAEMLKSDGTLYLDNLRSAKATDQYICSGEADETYFPTFTYHGFRYVQISGLKTKPTKNTLTAHVLHCDMERTGNFECSNPQLNQLQSNIQWGQKGNFLELPTDCPQRDERLGWTGDAQVFIPTATFNYDVSSFFVQWIQTLNDGQTGDGAYPDIAPDVFSLRRDLKFAIDTNSHRHGNAGWADAGIICPWEIYRAYGDATLLEGYYSHMVSWIDYQEGTSNGLIRPATAYGDWLAVDAIRPDWSSTPCELVGTAYFAKTTDIMIRIANLFGYEEDIERFTKLRNDIGIAFRKEFVSPNGLLVGDSQTAYLLALAFDLLESPQRERSLKRLVQLIERRENHLSTGFLGTPLLCPVLSRYGLHDLAYRILLQTSYPGWLYPIENGATTMWERWNSWTKDSGFGDDGMNSFNHYAYGAIGEWLYRTVGGIDQTSKSIGYKKLLIRPQAGGGLQWAKTSLQTPQGLARCEWSIEGTTFELLVEIPPNAIAEVHVPARNSDSIEFLSEPTWERIHTKPYTYGQQAGIYTLPAGVFRFRSQR
ncbi:family 78 glycoside hydrolase catalytic domain [Pelagicoccus enzymogenes]|uniref:family 78 glycoside hydrolase catalytic domain n=1 Tax=Pelagicoccus enzymogenes TaxID=2773457 RepID=UPI00281071EB|nr:family 78 glycoside hydrolase catalytic domain [Pelagicoccus enzymogenes]MDQ8198591.1 family 78 glycoside hydrolase catalytic domain [Pelagicoccus enzymogenes]